MYKCSLREVINGVPDIQTVTLPDDWFEQLNDKTSVFENLYKWMVDSKRIPVGNEDTLHNRTYVGQSTIKKLLSAEKKRLRKIHNLKGEALDSNTSWSNFGSGPRESLGMHIQISGDAIFVVPEASKSALSNFTSELFNKRINAHVQKVQSHASGASFYWWLVSQLERPDYIGDLAKETYADDSFPQDSQHYEELRKYLDNAGACGGAMDSLKDGWREYCQQYPERVQPSAWCGECHKKLDVAEAFLAFDVDDEELFVLDRDCLSRFESYSTMESRPLLEISHADIAVLVEKQAIGKFEANDIIEKLELWGVLPPYCSKK